MVEIKAKVINYTSKLCSSKKVRA